MSAKKIVLVLVLSLMVSIGYWYYHNQTAKNIVKGVISNPQTNLRSDNNFTNILLMGIGGQGHAGSDLTDSMLLVSFNHLKNTATIVPIPRDIWVPSMKAKINTAYHYGNESRPGGGLDLAKSAVSETMGLPLHYAITLDFQGFVKAIDAVGGVDVEIENTFDDYKYPIPGKETVEPESDRYEHIHFEAGTAHMDGQTALKFARSRHAEGDEGTDFARGARQQKIILAFRNKVLSLGTIFNTEIMTSLKNSVSDSVNTDITDTEQGSFARFVLGLGNHDSVRTISIADYFVNPKNTRDYAGQWVLIPTTSWEDIHTYVAKEIGSL